jgi:hypothetical protein
MTFDRTQAARLARRLSVFEGGSISRQRALGVRHILATALAAAAFIALD